MCIHMQHFIHIVHVIDGVGLIDIYANYKVQIEKVLFDNINSKKTCLQLCQSICISGRRYVAHNNLTLLTFKDI